MRTGLYLALAVAMLLASGSVRAEEPLASWASDSDNIYRNLELFTSILELVRNNYVEEVSNQELIYGALQGMLGALDPYSSFMEPESYGEMQVETKGEFGGLGIEITMRNGILTVITPIEDTPASRAGIHPGDRIVKIDGDLTDELTLTEAVHLMRGKPGTDVTITVMRAGERELLDFTITRAVIQIESVKEARVMDGGIGYLRLAQFLQKTPEEVEAALDRLRDGGMKGLILDLRYNPGGLLSSAIDVAEFFLPEDRVVVKTLGRGDQVEMEVKSTEDGEFTGIPMVVLINEGSASGSEIVAGALRDNDRALLVGTTSFGKGSVQTVLPMPDQSGVRLTTGHYYTASGRIIHEKGIEPDIVVPMTPEEQKKFLMKKYSGMLDYSGADAENASPEEKILRQALQKVFQEESSVEEQRVMEMVVERLMGRLPGAEPAPSPTPVPGEGGEEGEAASGERALDREELDPQMRAAVDIMQALILEKQFAAGESE